MGKSANRFNTHRLLAKAMRNFILLTSILMAGTAWGQQLPSILINDVLVSGNERASVQVIRSTARLYTGKSVTMMDLQQAIRRLWGLGFFADVQIYLEEETEDGAILRVAVDEYPSLEEVVIEGDRKIRKNKILDKMELQPPSILSEYAVAEAVRKIKDLYHDDGFLNVEVTPTMEPGTSPHGRILKININENRKVKLRQIRFAGNEMASDLRLRMQMKNTKRWRWYVFWREAFDRDEFEEDLANIITYYRTKGYRDARILRDSLMVLPDGKGLELTINISEGVPYYYRNITWEGNKLHTSEELAAVLGFSRGDTYNNKAFSGAVAQRVHPVYMDEGYLYSQVQPVEYPVGEDSVDVVFNIVENQKVSVRYIHVLGNEKTRDYVIRRELRINPGDTFSYEKLGRSQRDVWILNFFENVEPNVLPVDDDEVDLSITVTERSSDRANLSVGYTELNGFIGGGGIEFNNLLGTGQRLNISYNRGFQSQVGGFGLNTSSPLGQSIRGAAFESFSLSIINPWLYNTPTLLGASAFYTERGSSQLLLPFTIIQWGGTARLGRRFRWPDTYFRGTWVFQGGEKRYFAPFEELKGFLSGLTEADMRTDEKCREFGSSLGISITRIITRDSRDRPEFPTRGSQFEWLTTLSGMRLGGNEDFQKHSFTLKWFAPVLSRKLVFYQMTKLGYIEQVQGADGRSILPPDEKFYMGGSGITFGEMLRGYRDNTVGPYSNGPRGATVLMKYSAELRLLLSPSPTVYVHAFVDMGNAWANLEQADPFNLKRSAGVGVRLFMPMLGMLGLDLGYGFDSVIPDNTQGARGWEMHFIFGQPF